MGESEALLLRPEEHMVHGNECHAKYVKREVHHLEGCVVDFFKNKNLCYNQCSQVKKKMRKKRPT